MEEDCTSSASEQLLQMAGEPSSPCTTLSPHAATVSQELGEGASLEAVLQVPSGSLTLLLHAAWTI